MERFVGTERFRRFATWPPDTPLPASALAQVWAEIEVREDAAVATKRLSEDAQVYFPLRDEFYLRDLFEIDPDSQGDLERFVSRLGFLFGRYGETDKTALVGTVTDDSGPLGPYATWGLTTGGEGKRLTDRRRELFMELVLADHTYPFELLDEIRLGLCWLRDLSRLAISFQESGWADLPDEWETARFGIRKPQAPDEAFAAFVTGVNAGVRSMPPHIYIPRIEVDPRYQTMLSMGGPSLYSVVVSQIFNHIAERAPYRRCANESCGRVFVRQVHGAAEYAPRLEGVKFCSAGCREAQKQRKSRRRKREEGKR